MRFRKVQDLYCFRRNHTFITVFGTCRCSKNNFSWKKSFFLQKFVKKSQFLAKIDHFWSFSLVFSKIYGICRFQQNIWDLSIFCLYHGSIDDLWCYCKLSKMYSLERGDDSTYLEHVRAPKIRRSMGERSQYKGNISAVLYKAQGPSSENDSKRQNLKITLNCWFIFVIDSPMLGAIIKLSYWSISFRLKEFAFFEKNFKKRPIFGKNWPFLVLFISFQWNIWDLSISAKYMGFVDFLCVSWIYRWPLALLQTFKNVFLGKRRWFYIPWLCESSKNSKIYGGKKSIQKQHICSLVQGLGSLFRKWLKTPKPKNYPKLLIHFCHRFGPAWSHYQTKLLVYIISIQRIWIFCKFFQKKANFWLKLTIFGHFY